MNRTLAMLLAAACAIAFSAGLARADAIDGEWCYAGSNFVIEGPNIRTPGGSNIVGDYDRHGFRYVVPPNEPGAGTRIVMALLNEENVQLTRGTAAAPEIWKRCKPTS